MKRIIVFLILITNIVLAQSERGQQLRKVIVDKELSFTELRGYIPQYQYSQHNNLSTGWILVDSMTNIYGYASSEIHPLFYSPRADILTHVHRGDATSYAATSGEIYYTRSTNGGATWTRCTAPFNPFGAARYPSGSIYYSENADGYYQIAAWANLDDAPSFGDMGYGSGFPLASCLVSSTIVLRTPTKKYGVGQPTWSSDQMAFWAVQVDNGERHTGTEIWKTPDFSAPSGAVPPSLDTTKIVNNRVMFGGDAIKVGSTWITAFAFAGSAFRVYHPNIDSAVVGPHTIIVVTSTNNGTTWSAADTVDLTTLSGVGDYRTLWSYDGSLFSTEGGMVLDSAGYPHVFCGLQKEESGATGSDVRLAEIWKDNSGWKGKLVASANPSTIYDQSVGQTGYMARIARNESGTFFIAQWIDSKEANNKADIYVAGKYWRAINWIGPFNITNTSDFGENLAHLSPRIRRDGDSLYSFFSSYAVESNQNNLGGSPNRTYIYVGAHQFDANQYIALSVSPDNRRARLNWSESDLSALLRYRIYRSTASPPTVQIDSVDGTTTSYTDDGLTNGITYYYRVVAVDSLLTNTQRSNVANVAPLFSPPTNLSAVPGNHQVILNWTASTASNVMRYRIYRGTSSPATTLIDSVPSTTTTYVNYGLTNGVQYYYRIIAVDSTLDVSSPSNEESATPFNLPPEAVALEDVFLPNEGRELTSTLQFSSAGSSDPDGQIDSIYWYVEDDLVGREEQLTYDFGPGTMRVMLVVQDNEGATDTSSATVTRSVFQTITNGPVLGGLSLLGEDILYAVVTGDAIYRMDIDGKVLYTLEVGGDVLSASSIAADTTVYIASSDRNLYAFSKFGAPVWPALPLGGVLSATPTIDSIANRIYIGVQNRNFFAVNRISGSVAWSYFCDAPIKSSAVITLDRRLVFCSSKGTLYGFDLENLPNPIAPTWTLSLGDSVTSSPAMDQEGFIYVGTKTGKIIKILLGGGGATIVWEQQAGSSIYASPVIDGSGTLYVGSMDSMFYAINTLTGSINWSFPTNGSIRSTAAVSNTGIIYFANDDGQVFALNSSGEVQWRYKHPSAISAPLLYRSGTLYLGTEDSLIVALYDGEGLMRKSYANALTVPAWGTFQGNNQRTGVQSVAGATPNFSFVVQSGWNMVSVPLAVNNYRKDVLFPTAVSAAYSFHNGYIQKDTLELGIGYWLKFSNAQDLGLNGIPLSNDTIIVSSGWNMIGSISSPVEVSTIVSNPPGMITSQFFGYKQGYFVSDSIYPAKGYWVKVNQNGQLILSSASIQSKVNRIRIVPTNELPPSPPDGEKTDDKLSIPKHFALKPNYPNPFNPSTVIRYQLPVKSYVTLKVYNVLGQEVGTVVNEVQDAGYKSAEFHASRLPSGVYFYRMTAVGQDGILSYTDVKKMLLLK